MQGFGIKFSIPKTPELQKMLETREKAQMILQARITEVFDKAEADPKKAGELLKKVEASTYIQCTHSLNNNSLLIVNHISRSWRTETTSNYD